ncbi:MAG: radical SAM protein [Anaerolineae bacterium]|nr:MAG: radical SAM protein [Anaerolineae bacterium]
MKLSGLHILLTYQCTFECDHCFVWGSPWQKGTLTLTKIRRILEQALDVGTIQWVFFEGGEPFLYFPILLEGVRRAAEMGFRVGVVSNAYWATSLEDAIEWLRPFVGLLADLSISNDLYHYDEASRHKAGDAVTAAERLGIPVGTICIAQPETTSAVGVRGQLPPGESEVMFRGRAARKLVARAALRPWRRFNACPHEDLREPGRVHLDPLGYVHICQGISIGNIFERSLREICEQYSPESHPVIGPLLTGGPVALVEEYGLPHAENYADACHLCYEARLALRGRFPKTLAPDQMYGG